MAPPTYPGPFLQPDRASSWPKVFGIITIILGAVGILIGCTNASSPLWIGWFAKMMPAGQPTGMEFVQQHPGLVIAVALGGSAVAALGLLAGIGLVQRRRWGVRFAVTWSVVRIVFVIFEAGYSYVAQKAALQSVQQDSQVATIPSGFMQLIFSMSMVATVAWGWGLPIFLLIWLSRKAIKEEIASWS